MRVQTLAAMLGLSAAITAISPALAQAPSARPTDPIYQCATKLDDAERLACFDKAVADLKVAESSGKVRTVDMAAVEKIERDSFGFSLPSLNEIFRREDASARATAPEVEEVTFGITSISVNNVTRKATIRLENGQVWEQIDSEQLSRSKIRKSKEATIRKAALGSFMMTLDRGNAGIRVRRVS
ncbi:MAG: hypothetical protein ACK4P2_01540 [Hyphomonas sp.]